MSKIILIIEDDIDIRTSLKEFLESEDYIVFTAGNGLEALEVINTIGMPNLMLLDMKMPIMNGWQFAVEFISKHDHLSPIVVMTAAADAEQRAKEISAIGWVGKPFKLDELLKKIKKYERP
jgi:DNA-binding response OmpR family regulator